MALVGPTGGVAIMWSARESLACCSSYCQPSVMASGRCPCGRRADFQCPGSKVALVRIYYCVRQTSGATSPLLVEQGWWCLRGDAAELTADAVIRMIDPPGRQRDISAGSKTLGPISANRSRLGPHADMGARTREATGTYLTDRIDSWLGALG